MGCFFFYHQIDTTFFVSLYIPPRVSVSYSEELGPVSTKE